MNRTERHRTGVILLLLLIGAPAVAQDSEDAAYENMTTRQLKAAIIDAEDRIYEMFNDLNTVDDYDMICKRETGLGSHFRRRVCKPKMLRDLDLRYSADNAIERPEGANKKIYKDQRQIMLDTAAENPALMELMVSRVRMLRLYNQRKRKE